MTLAIVVILVLTAVFYVPAIFSGYFADDRYHQLILQDAPRTFFHDFNLFSFVRTPAEVRLHRENGIAPWWTADDFRIDFYRPLPSLTHWLDHALFGADPRAAHLVSIGWYLLSLVLLERIFRRFFAAGSRFALVALVVFALDDTHALAVQWIANRSDLVAAVFFLTAVLGYLRLREGRTNRTIDLALLFGGQLGALLSKESSVVLPVVLLAHALLVEPKSPNRTKLEKAARARNVALHVALFLVTFGYLFAYLKSGHGPSTLYYLNPLKSPVTWATQLFRSGFFHQVILATGVPLHVLSASPMRDHPILAAVLATMTIGFWAIAWKLLHHDRKALFFAAWMIVSQAILTTSFPDPRLLFMPSIGFAYLVARIAEECWRLREEWRPARGIVVVLASLHLVVAPVLVHVCLHVVSGFQRADVALHEGVKENVDLTNLPRDGVEVFFLDCPSREATSLANLSLLRELPTGSDPLEKLANAKGELASELPGVFREMRVHYFALSFLVGPIDVRALSDHELTISPEDGSYFPSVFEQLYLTSPNFHVGQTFVLEAFTATIDATNDHGEVTRVRFTFPKPLSSSRYRFLHWDGTRWAAVHFDAPNQLAQTHP